MAVGKRVRLAILVVVVLALFSTGMGVRQWLLRPDPCVAQDREPVLRRFPALEELSQRQRQEADRLLARQRAQDMELNFEIGGQKLTPEEALRLSVRQIEELSALRREHQAEFEQTCHALVAAR